MQLAIALVLLFLAVLHSVRSSDEQGVFGSALFGASLMWPVAAAFYPPLLVSRNVVWVVLGGLSLWRLLAIQKPVALSLWPIFAYLGFMVSASLWALNGVDNVLRAMGTLLMMVYVIAQTWSVSPRLILSRAVGVLTIVSCGILVLLTWIAVLTGFSFSRRLQMVGLGLKATGLADFALMALIVFAGSGAGQRHAKRIILLLAAASIFFLMVLTQTRGTLFALLAVMGFLVVFGRGPMALRWKFFAYLLVLAFLSAYTLAPGAVDEGLAAIAEHFRLSDTSELSPMSGSGWAGRWGRWSSALEKAHDHPILGRGTGTSSFVHVPDAVLASATTLGGFPVRTVHSQYLETYYDHGVVGLGLLIAILGWISWAALSVFVNPPPGLETEAKTLVLLWITVPIGMITHGGYFSSGNPQRMWIWLAGMVLVRLHQTCCKTGRLVQ